jgi:preprotein translocase subunit SecE
MARTNPVQFIQQVRAEVSKIVWPTRREVVLTTLMVFVLASLTSIFFSFIDLGIRSGLSAVFGLF